MCHIEDGQALVYEVTLDDRAGWEPEFHHNFILLDVVSDHALLSSYLKKSGHVEQTESLNVDGATKFVNAVISMRVGFLHGRAFSKLIRVNNRIDFLISTPVHKIREHELHLGQVKFSCATKPQQIMFIEVKQFKVSNFSSVNPFFKVSHDLIHLRGRITHKSSFFWLFRL